MGSGENLVCEIEDATVRAHVARIEEEAGGVLCFAFRDLRSGRMVTYRGDRKVKTASVIKLPILVHVAMAAREGSLFWEEPLTLTEAEKVEGSGVLQKLSPGLQISLRDVCTLMTIISDNTATNMVIERIGAHPINTRMRDLGLAETTVFRKAYSPDTPLSVPYGLGVTTPLEMVTLLTLLAEGRLGGEATCAEIVSILEGQHYRDAIPRMLPAEWKYAGKTGAVDGVRNDVGIVTAPDGGVFALALFAQELMDLRWTADNRGLVALARLAKCLLAV